MTKKNKKIDMESDETVEEYLKTWDIVYCRSCGKEVSMLDSTAINNGEYFVCDNCLDGNKKRTRIV